MDQYANMLRRRALTNSLVDWTVPKNRKPKFDLTLTITDLLNIPLTIGTSHVKWHLPSSTSAEHRGRTDKCLIARDHKCTYGYSKTIPIRMTVNAKSLTLEDSHIHFEIIQDYAEGTKGGRVVLGNVKLNLAEYVDREPQRRIDGIPRDHPGRHSGEGPRPATSAGNAGGDYEEQAEGITRRYLMQDSKINSTLKIGLHMLQTEGDTSFVVPPLKTATIFGGIAGVVTSEATDGVPRDGDGAVPTFTSKTRELSELQDMYRRTLAATWACCGGELPPDKLVEDLFAGGNGGGMPPPTQSTKGWRVAETNGSSDEPESRLGSSRTARPGILAPDAASSRNNNYGDDGGETGRTHHHHHHHHQRHGARSVGSAGSGGSGIEGEMHDALRHRPRNQNGYREATEFEIREDLKSWRVQDANIIDMNAGHKHKHKDFASERARMAIMGM